MADTDIVSRLNRILSGADERGLDETECRAIRDAAAEIGQLRKERDEARREILESLHPDLRESYAAAREWDYLKENTND